MEVLDRMLNTMQHAWSAMGRGSAEWVHRDGIGALHTRGVPDRSIVNAVVPLRNADVQGAYSWLDELFSDVNAWTVWIPEDNRELAGFLESRGHRLDADPAMMVLNLPGWNPPVQPADWQPATVEGLARVNEAAYPWRDGSMERAILESAFDDDEFRLYITEGTSVLGVDDCDGDAGVLFVATEPEARGRGLAARLLAAAMVEARDRGCDISTLQATKMGESVYARLGYQRIGAMQMWERRKA